MRLGKLRWLIILFLVIANSEIGQLEPSASAKTYSAVKPEYVKKTLLAPNFSVDDVTTVVNTRQPPGQVQLNIWWSGFDKNFDSYPKGTKAEILVDGLPSGFTVTPHSSTNIYVTAVVHAITLRAFFNELISPPSFAAHSQRFAPKVQGIGPNLIVGEPVLPPTNDPHLGCAGSGELIGDHPGWSSSSAIKLTVVGIDADRSGVYWCPATAPFGKGQISYTVTATPDAVTCVTVKTYCLLPNTFDGKLFSIMATDQTGSYTQNIAIIPNTGVIEPCANFVNWCNVDPVFEKYSTFGNSSPELLGDCTFAAIAHWEEAFFGIARSSSQIISEYKEAVGNTNAELTNDQVFSYWSRFGIGDTYLDTAIPHPLDPLTLKKLLDTPNTRELIAQIHLTAGTNFAGYQISKSGNHWIDIDGYSPKGPVIITWGQILQMTWQQWNYDALNMWSITTK